MDCATRVVSIDHASSGAVVFLLGLLDRLFSVNRVVMAPVAASLIVIGAIVVMPYNA